MSRLGRLGNRLYSGEMSLDFVGRRKLWYAISAAIVVTAILGLFLRPLNFGIEFEGGVEFRAEVTTAPSQAIAPMREAVVGTGLEDNPTVTTSGSDTVRIETQSLNPDQIATVKDALQSNGATAVSTDFVGPSWGHAVAERALIGLLVFLGLVILFIGFYFREWKMSIAAIVALIHDVVITVGVYALAGFEVTPATVTGVLTILGYSLYDTVVVFDKVRENTRGSAASSRRTYAESANLAVNQTLVRSINTSVAALLPVAAILYISVTRLGAGPLEDLALALLVGMAAGTYSSIFIATPLLVQLKYTEAPVRAQEKRVLSRRGGAQAPLAGVAAAGSARGSAGQRRRGSGRRPSPDAEPPARTDTEPATEPAAEPAAEPMTEADAEPGREPATAAPGPRRHEPAEARRQRQMSGGSAKQRSQPQRQSRSKRSGRGSGKGRGRR